MKITRRQLGQIIKEELSRVFGEVRDLHKGYLTNYLDWVRDSGHITPASSSVMATYFLDKGMEDDHDLHKHLAASVRIDHEDVMRDMEWQRRDEPLGGWVGDALTNDPDYKDPTDWRSD